MRPSQSDLRSASFTLELLNSAPEGEQLEALALCFATQRRVTREQTFSPIELWARDQKAKAEQLRKLYPHRDDFNHGVAQGMEIVLVGLRRVIRELRIA